MTFGVPLFLIAAFAAAIPVVLHMVNRQKAKDLPFSTLRFLKISVEKTRRRRRIQDVLLMLVRMAVLALVAMGLAKPAITHLSGLWGGGANSAVAIILDNSASMGVVDQGQVRIETARAAAGQIMDELGDGDQVALYMPCGPKFDEAGKLDRNHDKVLQMLGAVNVSYERADLAVEVEDARKLLVGSEAPNKQIYVISDMQNLSWEGLREAAGQIAGAEGQPLTKEEQQIRDIPIILVDCHRSPKPNVAVADVRIETAVPVAGLPVKATVDLFNASPVLQQRHLELYVDGARQVSSPALEIPAGGRLTHQLDFTFQRGGLRRGEVRLVGDDGSKLDDRRFFTMEVDQGIPVAIVKAERHEIAYLDDTYYVEKALSPGRGSTWAISTTPITADELPSEPLSNYTVIFCVNLPALDADTAGRLASYVATGGNLVWICGDNVEPAAYNRMNESAGGQLLPTPLGDVRTPVPGQERDSWSVGFLDKEHPALRHLAEPASLYESILVYKHVRMDAEGTGGARVMARLDDGEPLMAQRPVDQGSVTMIATSAHVGWNNLPLRPIFLPLLARLTFDLAGTEQARFVALSGSPLVVPFEDQIQPTMVEVNPPSGATIRRQTSDEAGVAAGEFRFEETHQIGVYLLTLVGAVRPIRLAYSVNVDPDESDEAKIQRAEMEALFGKTPLVFADDPEDLSSTFAWLREGTSLWGTFLWAVLIGLVFETFFANRLSPKKEDEDVRKIAPGMRRLAKKGRAA